MTGFPLELDTGARGQKTRVPGLPDGWKGFKDRFRHNTGVWQTPNQPLSHVAVAKTALIRIRRAGKKLLSTYSLVVIMQNCLLDVYVGVPKLWRMYVQLSFGSYSSVKHASSLDVPNMVALGQAVLTSHTLRVNCTELYWRLWTQAAASMSTSLYF